MRGKFSGYPIKVKKFIGNLAACTHGESHEPDSDIAAVIAETTAKGAKQTEILGQIKDQGMTQ